MNANSNFGICFCEHENGYPESFRLSELISYIKNLQVVSAIWHESELVLTNIRDIVSTIKKKNVNKILIIGNRPGHLKTFFSKSLKLAGMDPADVQLFSFRDHGIFSRDDQDMARAILAGIIYDFPNISKISEKSLPVNPDTVIIGAGITGIQAALEIANSGHKVFLIEKKSTIGGHMAMFDKTCSTLDCAACILTPKMVEVGQHPNIELLTLSEVTALIGKPGDFKLRIKKKARYVTDKCTGCGECTKVCPIEISSEFDAGLIKRKAIHRDFPQAIPNIYAITRDGSPHCKLACPIGQDVEGYMALAARGMFKEAHELIRRTNALPSICGRVCYHSCEEVCKRAYLDEPVSIRNVKRFITEKYSSDQIHLKKEEPTGKKVAVVGSGPSGLACAHDLALCGHDVTIFEKHKKAGGMLITGIPEFRLPRNVLEEDINFIRKLGVKIKLNSPVGKKIPFEDLKRDYDAVYLATGAHKSLDIGLENEDAKGILHGVDFLRMINLEKEVQVGKNVIVIGGGNTAIDSARVAIRLGARQVTIVYRRSLNEMPATEEEVNAAKEEGVHIRLLAAPKEFILYDEHIRRVRFARMKLGEPDESGRRKPVELAGEGFTLESDLVIIAASQKPEVDFLKKEKVKLSEWDTLIVDNANLAMNIPGFYAGGDAVSGPSSVVEAMAMGKRAALAIDYHIKESLNHEGLDTGPGIHEMDEIIRRSTEEITGMSAGEISDLKKKHKKVPRILQKDISMADRTTSFREVEKTFSEEEAIAEARRCLNCTICSICRECEKVCDPKAIDYNMKDEVLEINAGNIIVATGFKPFDPGVIEEYGYGRIPNVITSLEFERMVNASGPTGGKILMQSRNKDRHIVLSENGTTPGSLAIIHCVGSRNVNYNNYCSRVCCMYSLKIAHLVREKLPDTEIYEYYIDIRSFGKGYEEFYNRIQKEGINLMRGLPASIKEMNGKLLIRSEDIINGCLIEKGVDMAVLSVGLEAQNDASEIGSLLGITSDGDGWFHEVNYNAGPVLSHTEGITMAGTCLGPKDIPDSVVQGSAAAARVLQNIMKGHLKGQHKNPDLKEIEDEINET